MRYPSKRIDRRAEKRLELSLPITILGHKVKTKNVSPGGVYFEIIAKDNKRFSPGKTIKIEITANTDSFGLPGRMVRLSGIGETVRAAKIHTNRCVEKLGVALKFGEKLELYV